MRRLPIELYHLIFDQLQLTDLSACASVCKTLYATVKEFRIRGLAFDRPTKFQWFHGRSVIYQHRVDHSMATILSGSSFNFQYLKRLKIGRLSSIRSLNEINQFVYLEELDIDLKNYANAKSKTLSLANLRVLSVFVPIGRQSLELDTPKLATLCTFSLQALHFKYPEAVRCLKMLVHNGMLSLFRNLEHLAVTDYYNLLDYYTPHDSANFQECDLTKLNNLREVRFYRSLFGLEWTNLETIKRVIKKLLKRPSGPRIFWQSVRVTNVNLLDKYRDSMRNITSWVAFHFQHYEHLEKRIEYFWSYKFNISIRKLSNAGLKPENGRFVSMFFAKYALRRLHVVGHVNDRELLLQFIGSSKLMCLEFSDSGLGQEFFDRMAESILLNGVPVQRLTFKRSGIQLNFEFVRRLFDLETFETDLNLPGQMIAELLKLPLLIEIVFSSSGSDRKTIERRSVGRFRLNKELLSLRELLSHLQPELTAAEVAEEIISLCN